MKMLKVEVGWTKLPGTNVVLAHVLSASVKSIKLEFYPFPKSSLMHRYLDVIAAKATHLSDLSLQNVVKLGATIPHHDTLKDYHISDPSCQLLGQLLSLRSLTLSPKFVTVALLDTVGRLPQLTHLAMRSKRAGSSLNQTTIPHISFACPRKGLFKSLEELEVQIRVYSVFDFLSAYNLGIPPKILHTARITCNAPTSPDKLKLPHEFMQSISHLSVNFVGSAPLELRTLEAFAECDSLVDFKLWHGTILTIPESEKLMLPQWQNLECLSLVTYPKVRVLGYELQGLASLQGTSQLNISCLSFFAKELPFIRRLVISLLACDTSLLEDETVLYPFARLQFIKFGPCSFVNYELEGFLDQDAARYITALLPEDCQAELDFGGFRDTGDDKEWKEFEERYVEWLTSFDGRLSEYKKVRKSQTTLIRRQDGASSLITLSGMSDIQWRS
jgi:hypothetical protein